MSDNVNRLFIRDMPKNTFITVVIIALLTIIGAIYNFVSLSGDYEEMKALGETLDSALSLLTEEEIAALPSEATQAISIVNFYKVYVPILFTVAAISIVTSVASLIKIRLAFIADVVVYLAMIILEVVWVIFCFSVGELSGVASSVGYVVACAYFIKFCATVFFTSKVTETQYTPAPASYDYNLRPEAENSRYASAVPMPVGSDGSAMPAVGGQSEAMPAVGGEANAPINLAKPAARWTCSNCGVDNKDTFNFCELCGTKRNP